MCIAHACAEKVCDTTLDNEKYNWSRREAVYIVSMRVVVTALCNQTSVTTSNIACIAVHTIMPTSVGSIKSVEEFKSTTPSLVFLPGARARV